MPHRNRVTHPFWRLGVGKTLNIRRGSRLCWFIVIRRDAVTRF
ncbi:hypothetical protein [Pseudorhizobium endolithicum]|nr:hypothetical protein [Pseudorhizobium endolithicum]